MSPAALPTTAALAPPFSDLVSNSNHLSGPFNALASLASVHLQSTTSIAPPMAIGVERRAKKVASRLDDALLGSKAMSFSPLVHTSGVGLPRTDSTSLLSSEDRPVFNPALAGQPVDSTLQQQASKKRRPSKGKVPSEIRRSSSTPHMRNLALATSGELSPIDKKRNKLGYHRTSVACGHCRRRKIRCLLAPDDPQGRCANCIRLKKECNFYPVEQNPENQRPQPGPAKEAGTSALTPSTTSSPRHPASSSTEKIDEFRQTSATTSGTAAARYADVDVDPLQTPHSAGVHMRHPSFAYPPTIETQWPTPGFLPSSTIADSSPSSTGYWRPSPSTATSNYGSESNMSGGQTPTTVSTTSNLSYGGPHDSHNWNQPNLQPPTRSMSYGLIEGLPHHYSSQAMGATQQDFPRRTPPYPYPTTIDTTSSILHSTTVGDGVSAPLSAPILPNQQFGYTQPWNPYGGVQSAAHEVPMQGRSMSAQWFAEPTHLDQVQEEGGPPMTYSHHPMQQYYSGP